MKTAQEIEAEYSGAPTDWDFIELQARMNWRHDKLNAMDLSVDDVLTLIECRLELIRRDTPA